MKFYLPLGVLIWILSIKLVDWRRLPELLTYGLAGITIETVEDRIGRIMEWWSYHDAAPIDSPVKISLVIALSAAPLLSMLFAQGLDPEALRIPWGRIAAFLGVSMVPELIGLQMGHVHYGHGWNLFLSVLSHFPTWIGLWALHRYVRFVPRQRN